MKQHRKPITKAVSVLLSMVIVCSLFTIVPFEASAAGAVEYIYRYWDETNQKVVDETRTCTSYTTITSQDDLTIGDGKWYVVNGDATIENRVKVSGTAHIILLSGTLRCMYGIRLSKGNSLFVYPGKNSEGTLNPRTPHDEEANLGGNEGEDCGEFVFYGGTLEAHNYDWCSGGTAIGGGGEGGSCGKLSFYGGTVDATNNGRAPGQKSYGAVIGDGDEANSDNSDCYINIYGGNITVDNHSDSNGSGIGGGEDSTGCPINILGGKITARAHNGAAIGSGQDGGSSTITIKNAKIKAESEYGAGIGSGEDSDSESIIIENSYVEAASKTTDPDSWVGAEGAGIGGGNCGKSKYIKINKSVIIASSGRYGAGIGGGDESDGGTIEITDSCVFAHSAQGGAGIGGGDEKGCDSITLKDSFVVAITDSDMNEAGEKFLKDFGDYYNTIMYSISNPAVTEQAGFYAAGELTAMAIAYLIQGTHTGAGIGSGDSGKAEKILIDNCTVVTQAGECAAGIGGGDEGGFGTIDIKNSHIYSQGGKYGAGIGSGDEAEDCGTINITDSDITAYGGSEGAGIGTGNETDETAKIHISNSTVDAHGGDYAAGIGGGDDVNGGTIKISDSIVKAYGGEDAAGIGGGEDGDGGHIEITDGSNVYAEGKCYGAGIGGGEDSSGEYCEIDSDCTVEAVSGGEGNVESIGHGDCGWYVSYTGGTLSLGRGTQVIAGSDSGSTTTYFGDSRFDAIRNNKYAKISPCEHKNTKWVPYTNEHPTMTHSQYCRNCGCRVDRTTENHIWNDSFVCTKCNVSAELSHIKFIERDNSGEHTTDFDTPVGTYYELPECKHVPDGYRFVCWKINDYGMMPGDIDLASGNYTVHALYLPVVQTTYIDEGGKEQTVQACRLNSDDVMLGDGFYVIDQNMESGNTMLVSGDAKLIIADGVTYTSAVGSYDPPVDCDPFNPSSLTLFGQREQTGTLDLSRTYYPAQIYHFTQYGAKVKGGHTDFITYESMTIFRGTFESNSAYAQGVSNLLGGKITIDCFAAARNIYLGSFGNDISVTINSIGYGDEYFKFNISDGVVLTDEEHLYSGTLTREQVDLMEGKTLKPYTAEDYELVRWNWSDDYKNATAVLRSNVSGAEKEVRAKVTYEESGKYRTSTARCTFLGQEYTTTQTKQIIFDVTVANTAHGSVTADKTSAKAGNSVKLEVTPDDGYVSSALYYTDKNGSKTEIDDNSFKMPESNVTVTADFVPITPMVEPYIDEDGEYHLGTVAYAEIDGEPYAVNEDGTIGDLLDSVELSYFNFELLDDDTYRINSYTGPTDTLSELVIPKTFNGKQITVLGNSSTPLIDYAGKAKTQFELTLNENIREIKGYTFYTMWVKKVKGDSSGLNKIGDYAFSWANSPDGYKLDIKLDYEGVISIGTGIFNNMNVTMRLKHATKFNTTSFSAQKVTYDFTDAHTYGDPTWQWADDHSSAKAKFTCTDSRCKHTETVNATVAKNDLLDKTVYSATVIFGGETYSDDKTVNKALSNVTVSNTVHGEVTADKTEAYEGEKVTLTVSPEAGYNLLSLTVKDAAGNDIEVVENQFTMPKSDVTVTPSFGAKQYAISYSFDEYERGWISGPLYADAGEEVTVNCAANSGYEVTKLMYRNGTGEYIAIDGNTFIMPASQIKIYAAYKLAEYNISYETDGNGSVTGAQKAHFNDRVPLTVTPDEGWALINLYAEEPEWNDPVGIIDNELVMIDSPVIVHAEFVPINPRTEPYIDENGEYRLGNIEHIQLGDDYFAVENGAVGRPLDSVELSYFDFTDNGSAYQINYYTGPTDDLTELVIPKTYKGKPITVLGTDNRSAFIANANPKPQFTLTLNENIREIKGYAFYTMWVKQVKGDSSGLNRIGDYAFSWANSPNSYTLDIKLDHEGTVTVGKGIFNNMTVTARIRHATKLSSGSFMQKSISYIFTDAHSYGHPKWTWSDDHGTAAAKFTCTDSRCKHEETVDAIVTSATKDGIITYTATAEFDEHTYTDTKTAIEDGVGAQLAGHSISLDGDIAVNFYMELSDSVIAHKDTAYMHFTIPVGGGTTMQDMLVKDAVIREWKGKEYYVFKCRVAAKEMTSEIKAQIIDGDQAGTEYTYSVKEYADYLIEHADEREDLAAAVPLVKKMLNYGAYAQIYFDKNPGTLANADLDDADKVLGEISFTVPETAFNLPDGVTFGGATLSLKSETTLSLYFKSSATLTFSCGDYTVETASSGGYQIARIRGIAAKQLQDSFTLTVKAGEENGSVTYSPMNYCDNALGGGTDDPKLLNVVKALVLYAQAADAYFPE